MINLLGTSDELRLVTSSTAPLDVAVSFITTGVGPAVKGRSLVAVSSATTTALVAAPGENLNRNIYGLSIRNKHATTANTITLVLFDGSSSFELAKVILAAGEQLRYDGVSGLVYLNAQGLPKSSQTQGVSAAAVSVTNVSVLAADVVNNNAVANSIANVTGLSFPVVAGETYWFEFFIDFTAAATTTGSRWSITGPSAIRLAYNSMYSLTATSNTMNSCVAFDLPSACNATSAATAGNSAYISGFITPSSDGNVIARFASEIASSAIIAKAGSVVRWMRVL